jgi:Holliday junction resolvasome RuvABC endonuclease subunit
LKILGLDQSLSASGICLRINYLENDAPKTARRFETGNPPRGITGDDRFRWFHEWFLGILASTQPDVLIYEDAASGHQYNKDLLFEIQGIIKMTAHQWKAACPHMRILSVNIKHLKMFATGDANADKDQMLEAMVRDFPEVQASNNDEVDAFWLTEVAACAEKLIVARTPVQLYVAAVVRGDPDAPALKKDIDREKGKRDRAAKKAAKGANDVLAHHAQE